MDERTDRSRWRYRRVGDVIVPIVGSFVCLDTRHRAYVVPENGSGTRIRGSAPVLR